MECTELNLFGEPVANGFAAILNMVGNQAAPDSMGTFKNRALELVG